MRAVIAFITAAGTWCAVCSTPSMRRRMAAMSRRGSRWMSLARCSNAYCHSHSTTWTTPWSLASSEPLVLPSSTSCSKLLATEAPVVLLAKRTDAASE